MSSYFLPIIYSAIILSLLYFFLSRSYTKKENSWELIVHWVLFGFIINFFGFFWLYASYPLPWITQGVLQLVGIFLLQLILSMSTALCFFVVAYSRQEKITKRYTFLSPLLFATSLTIAELLGSFIISVLYYGNDIPLGLHFTAGTLGSVLSFTPFVEFSYFGGMFALTFFLGYIAYTVSSKAHVMQYKYHVVVIFTLFLITHFCIPVRTVKENLLVGIVTTNFPSIKGDSVETLIKKRTAILHDVTLTFSTTTPPAIIVYPEDTRYIGSMSLQNKADLFINFNDTLFIDGDTMSKNGKSSNVSLWYYPQKSSLLVRGKELLLPFNEYIPLAFSLVFRLFVSGAVYDTYIRDHTYTPSHGNKTISFKGNRIGTLLCSEILSFSTISGLKQERPSLVFFQSQLSVFHDNPYTAMLLKSYSKIAAAQLRTTLISSVNGAPSHIVSPHGYLLRTIPTTLSTSTIMTPAEGTH